MDFVGAIKTGFKNYVNFRGTATRPEFWYWVLFSVLVAIVLVAVDRSGILGNIFSLATLLPSLSVTVRRLRDAGFSWVWLLLPALGIAPFIIGFVQFVNGLVNAGLTEEALANPELISPEVLNSLFTDDAVLSSLPLLLFSSLYLLLASILVQLIFTLGQSKSFEEGNKRVAPKGPETTAL
jgi:uncharacterized membrane protein YhaH (DUF805 family)